MASLDRRGRRRPVVLLSVGLASLLVSLADLVHSQTAPTVVPMTAHNLTWFLHPPQDGSTAGGFTMNQIPAPTRGLTVQLLSQPAWFSDPTLTGVFGPGALFRLTLPCTIGVLINVTYRLSITNAEGSGEQILGSQTEPMPMCFGTRTIFFPVETPVTLENQRLKLTIFTTVSAVLNLTTGPGTFLLTTNYTGTP